MDSFKSSVSPVSCGWGSLGGDGQDDKVLSASHQTRDKNVNNQNVEICLKYKNYVESFRMLEYLIKSAAICRYPQKVHKGQSPLLAEETNTL